MLFGQYLVKRNVVGLDAVLDALIMQSKATPTLCEAVYSAKLLTSTQQLAVMERQALRRCDYRTACVELGVWTEDLEDRALSHMYKTRPPFGHFLLQAGHVTFDQLTTALEQFVVEAHGQPMPAAAPPQADGPEEGVLDRRVLAELFEQLSEHRHQLLEGQTRMWVGPAALHQATIRDVLGQLHGVKACAKLSGATMIARLAHSLEDALAAALSTQSRDAKWTEQLQSIMQDGLRTIWRIKDKLEVEASERGYWGNLLNQAEFTQIEIRCATLCQILTVAA